MKTEGSKLDLAKTDKPYYSAQTLLIRLPDFVTAEQSDQARKAAATKHPGLASIGRITFESLQEGTCVQMMHIGPYSTEPETLDRIHAFMESGHGVQNGVHYEIYLSDPRKTEPDSMKTILRFPVKAL